MDRSGDVAAFDAEFSEFVAGGDIEGKSAIDVVKVVPEHVRVALKDGERVRVRDYYADKHRMVEIYDIIDGEGVKVRNVITEHVFGMTFKELEEGWDPVTPALQHGRSAVVDRLISEL